MGLFWESPRSGQPNNATIAKLAGAFGVASESLCAGIRFRGEPRWAPTFSAVSAPAA